MKIKAKTLMEVILSAVFSLAVVAAAPLVLKFVPNDTGKMILKPVFYLLLLGVPLVLCRILKNPIGSLGYHRDSILKQVGVGVALFAVLAVLLTGVVLALGDHRNMLLGAKKSGLTIIVYNLFYDLFIVGIGEETLFRGYFLERFRTLTGSGAAAVALSALLFGIWHYPGGQDVLQVLLTAVLGAFWGLARIKIKDCSTLSVGIAHGLYDSYLILINLAL